VKNEKRGSGLLGSNRAKTKLRKKEEFPFSDADQKRGDEKKRSRRKTARLEFLLDQLKKQPAFF
jgi:hypothetical protein